MYTWVLTLAKVEPPGFALTMPLSFTALLIALPLLAPAQDSANHYIGAAACARCHQKIAAAQSQSAMARTWRGPTAHELPQDFHMLKTDGPITYDLARAGDRFRWNIQLPGRFSREGRVEAVVGGQRQGLSFLARISKIDDEALERAPLVEIRFQLAANQLGLVTPPGFASLRSLSYEAILGRVIGPQFEQKCFTCHGVPRGASAETGVRCETCHGPGQAHLTAIARGNDKSDIINPARFTSEESLGLCGRCHSGFRKMAAPVPDELLISSQVVAIRNTECFKQGGGTLTCTECHNPHRDARENEAAYLRACRTCHSPVSPSHAGICPVNHRDGCIGCHMPKQNVNGFPMADHWIRVHSEVPAPSHRWEPSMRSLVVPASAFLRIISVSDESSAREIVRQLKTGASFSDLARKYSRDPAAQEGGYLGEKQLRGLDPHLADTARKLSYGEISPIVSVSGMFVILLRMPVDFLSRAMQLEREAGLLRGAGDVKGAASKYQQAVDIFPGFLRAYILWAQLEDQLGNSIRAGELLERAAGMHPDDATAQFNLGIARSTNNMREEAMVAYQKALDLEPEFMPAYLNLGLLLFTMDRVADAEVIFRKGLLIDPISAPMYYGLALAAAKQGQTLEAQWALTLAKKIDPDYVKQQQAQ